MKHLINNINVLFSNTPCYYYDINLLHRTLQTALLLANKNNFFIHYAIKANANKHLLNQIANNGFGADCVSANEITKAIDCGFNPANIVFAGVGKTDKEIAIALEKNICCFHCESVEELLTINQIATSKNNIANIALRINPDVDANTHHLITTGMHENKFGFSAEELHHALEILPLLTNIKFIGLHFHIGSQILDLNVFKNLATRINEIMKNQFANYHFRYLNVGGGLGIEYENPLQQPIPDFENYFMVFKKFLQIPQHIKIHFELGRSITGQCGSLITKVLYIKDNGQQKFAIVDAGMNNLIRPALYGAKHKIINLTATGAPAKYHVVGPVCETSDCFGKNIIMPETRRGNLLAILSCGAYGEVMESAYNLREHASTVFSDNIEINALLI